LAAESGQAVLYVATAQALDEEMQARIAVHQSERPAHWQTLELPAGLGQLTPADLPPDGLVLLDCLNMLAANLILQAAGENLDAPDEARAAEVVENEVAALLALIQASPTGWIIVSNEVGLGLVPPYPVGRLFRDLPGRANQQLAAQADEVFFLVAGIAVPIHQFRS
jgi:adenosylcobinamide kinase/adenosylcobinamide-phosphate guanylyltransferase